MTVYLIRRLAQMFTVVLLSTMAIYALLNLAPGGPLSGIRTANANIRTQVTEADIARLESYLGIDRPLALRYITWMIGDDWLGADWMSLAPRGYPISEETRVRFWADPGVAHLHPSYEIWVRGATNVEGILEATYIEVSSTGTERPADVTALRVSHVRGTDIETERIGVPGTLIVRTTEETEFVIPGAISRPEDGTWVNIGWLFNAYHGLLGRYAGFHGSGHGVLRLDWGVSWKIASGQPVLMLVESRLGNTLLLMILATLVSLVMALPIGIMSAVKQYSVLDYFVTTFSFFGSSMPVFWFGLMVILIFSYKFRDWGLPYMPAGGVMMVRAAPEGQVLAYLNAEPGGWLDRAIHLFMPVMVLSLAYLAGWSRFTRSSMLEVLRQDYIRTARAKGLRDRMVLGKHALRNALLPLITVVVFQIPTIFGGATITETVFSYHGVGRLYYDALVSSDWPVAMTLLLITAILVVVATLLGDILYTLVDPRIRYS